MVRRSSSSADVVGHACSGPLSKVPLIADCLSTVTPGVWTKPPAYGDVLPSSGGFVVSRSGRSSR